jgi:hypothetical protein
VGGYIDLHSWLWVLHCIASALALSYVAVLCRESSKVCNT